jgi:hypothetical protein
MTKKLKSEYELSMLQTLRRMSNTTGVVAKNKSPAPSNEGVVVEAPSSVKKDNMKQTLEEQSKVRDYFTGELPAPMIYTLKKDGELDVEIGDKVYKIIEESLYDKRITPDVEKIRKDAVEQRDKEILQAYKYHRNSGLDMSFPAYMRWEKDPEVGMMVSGGKKYIREDLIPEYLSHQPTKEEK